MRAEPGTCLTLGLGDLASSHLDGDLGAALLPTSAAIESREVEPLVCFDEVDRDAPPAGRIGNAQLEQGVDIAALGICKAAADKEFRTLLANCTHVNSPPGLG